MSIDFGLIGTITFDEISFASCRCPRRRFVVLKEIDNGKDETLVTP
jgi:hypothetical protein